MPYYSTGSIKISEIRTQLNPTVADPVRMSKMYRAAPDVIQDNNAFVPYDANISLNSTMPSSGTIKLSDFRNKNVWAAKQLYNGTATPTTYCNLGVGGYVVSSDEYTTYNFWGYNYPYGGGMYGSYTVGSTDAHSFTTPTGPMFLTTLGYNESGNQWELCVLGNTLLPDDDSIFYSLKVKSTDNSVTYFSTTRGLRTQSIQFGPYGRYWRWNASGGTAYLVSNGYLASGQYRIELRYFG